MSTLYITTEKQSKLETIISVKKGVQTMALILPYALV